MAAPKVGGIYEIVNLVNGKRYVGSAADFQKRWRAHRSRLKAGSHHSRHLQAAWSKYGPDAFAFRVLFECAKERLLAEEQVELDRTRPAYNVCRSATSTIGVSHSDETKRKIADSATGRKCPPRSAEHRAKLSDALTGRQKSPEHMAALQEGRSRQAYDESRRQRVSSSLKAAYHEGRKNRTRPPEYREKIAATLRGRELSPEHKAAVSAAMTGKKRGPYKIDPAKADAKREAGKRLAALVNQRRWATKAG